MRSIAKQAVVHHTFIASQSWQPEMAKLSPVAREWLRKNF